MTWNWHVIAQNWPELLIGLRQTIILWIGTSVLGFLWGLVLAFGRMSHYRLVRIVSTVLLEVLRGVPLLVLLIWIYYAFPLLSGFSLSPMAAAITALSLYGGSYYGEIVRAGIASVDRGQVLASMSLGMTPVERMRRIILPQAFKTMIPPLVNQTIIQLKNTAQASVVTAAELLYVGTKVSSETYRPIEVYTTIAVMYIIIIVPTSFFARKLEARGGTKAPSRRRMRDLPMAGPKPERVGNVG